MKIPTKVKDIVLFRPVPKWSNDGFKVHEEFVFDDDKLNCLIFSNIIAHTNVIISENQHVVSLPTISTVMTPEILLNPTKSRSYLFSTYGCTLSDENLSDAGN